MADYTKLSDLVNDLFTVEKVWGYKWKKWNADTKKFEIAQTWERDFQKKWDVDTDRGKLDLSQSQMANLLELTCKNGVSDINGRTFSVKSNGKTGMEIRYFFNLSGTAPQSASEKPVEAPQKPLDILDDDDISLDEIPF